MTNNKLPRYQRFVEMTKSKRLPVIAGDLAHDGKHLGYAVSADAFLVPPHTIFAEIGTVLQTTSWTRWLDRIIGTEFDDLSFLDYEYGWYANALIRSGHFSTGIDPFRIRKWANFEQEFVDAESRFSACATLHDALLGALLGNSADRSQIQQAADFVLLAEPKLEMLDRKATLSIVADNFGREFLDDLILAIRFHQETGQKIEVHVKKLPIFVSDTTINDCDRLLQYTLKNETKLSEAINSLHNNKKLLFKCDEFWSSPLGFSEIPHEIFQASTGTIIIKGDLNYRRAIDDVVVAADTPFADLPSLPRRPLLSLRSVKSYCLAGVGSHQVDPWEFPMDGSIFLAQEVPAAGGH
ncbi:ARMT1-like domain-containing protein [Devosia faecipullorum]|uniref:ARMT1-like domain-containing protein n=1 Tax=Devosia faecipullorum TaxID=2755039 RepID=UPI00187B5CC1|nr:ARMT1-like domain-containing protein [Devosia faecipullorum]MBE7732373.1 DUF89 family protein [Devosia faecipullorum]